MLVRSARLIEAELDLLEPFETSFGVERRRRFLLLRLETRDGLVGWGECVAGREPLYSSESVATAEWVLAEYFLPWLLDLRRPSAETFGRLAARFRGQRMARAVVEGALLDLWAQKAGRPLGEMLGGRRRRVEVGVSVGIHASPDRLVRRVGRYLDAGYRRVKLKVRPGWDAVPVAAVRRAFPDVEIWVDANQAYGPSATGRIRRWASRSRVAQVEQPFPERAIRAHAALVRGAGFRVCLDESIVDRPSLEDALGGRALTSLNVKVGRVGGLRSALDLGRRARAAGIAAWVGGMLESGIGRAANVHLASHAAFGLPGDLSASDRYYADDLLERPFVLGPGSTLEVPRGAGLGVEISDRAVRRATRRSRTFRA